MRFRLDRGAALMTSGVLVTAAAAFVAAALWWSSTAAGFVAVMLVVIAMALGLRPPVVLHLNADGYRSRLRFSSGRFVGSWADVEDAELADGVLVLITASGRQAFPLRLVADRRVQLLRAVNEFLDAAHGYRRWLG